MSSPKEIIRDYDIKPRKSLGQSFLMEQNIIRRISAIAQVTNNDIVVEIGAGIGVLTEDLARNAAKLIAVELDSRLVEVLKDKLLKYNNVQIYQGDILKFDFEAIARDRKHKIKVIGNVPYNISSPALFHLLSFRKIIDSFVLMLQKEVVQRLVASPGGKNYGVPSVILQMFANVEKVFDVPASSFYPRPKVESSIIKGFFLDKPVVELADEEFFIKLVRDSFAHRRKMLINNLKKSKLLEGVLESLLKETLIFGGIDPQRRGETLTIEEFGHMGNILKQFKCF
ncbi:MAG: 16S rRNA (adenine(1518)-N(6)/adenine(1519)-N(6))-dimethyltransferase RsmA [Deltaproteobacteria bacterium]|nr:16S rRNA (adenine(1518)-N(6)/adenine(1519)-N(6))-dimethyltransferase RsmA [Deltaproteobacteria bacterium]